MRLSLAPDSSSLFAGSSAARGELVTWIVDPPAAPCGTDTLSTFPPRLAWKVSPGRNPAGTCTWYKMPAGAVQLVTLVLRL